MNDFARLGETYYDRAGTSWRSRSAATGEIIHARLRRGSANTACGARRSIEELVARVRRGGASGRIVLRVDSGFWPNDTIATLNRLGAGPLDDRLG